MDKVNEGVILVAAFQERDKFGNTLFYPNNSVASQFCKIANKKTLSRWDLERLDDSPHYVVKTESFSASPYGG